MQLIYDHLLPGKPVWDFCCDHGYLGLNAYESGLFSEVHFVDQVPHIVANLQRRFEAEYWRKDNPTRVVFHAHSGAEVRFVPSGTVVIAGVGAYTIAQILKALGQRGAVQADRLILGPQRDEEKLCFLLQNDAFAMGFCEPWWLSIEERGRNRKLLIFDKIL